MAALVNSLNKQEIPVWVTAIACLLWLPFLWITFGGAELWLAALSLLALDLAASQKWGWTGIVAGLTLLVTPLGLIFVLLIGMLAIRDDAKFYGYFVWIPGGVWFAFAIFYYGWDGLQGLTLPGIEGSGFLGIVPAIILIPFAILFGLAYRKFEPAFLALVLACMGYSLIAVLLESETSAILFTLALVISAVVSYNNTDTYIRLALMGALAGAVLIAAYGISDYQPNPEINVPELVSSKGVIGTYQETFALGGIVYHLDGRADPHLYALAQSGDITGIFLATAPDYLLLSQPPDDSAFQQLQYQQVSKNLWQRTVEIGQWGASEQAEIEYSPDVELAEITLDREHIDPGGTLRLRADWILQKAPTQPVTLILNLLDATQANYGSMRQEFPPEKWEFLSATTYHVLPINSDAPPGLYNVVLGIDYNAALLNQFTVAQVKIPVSSDREFEQPPIAEFGEGLAGLMVVEVTQEDEQLVIHLVWRADGTFNEDFTIFLHLTPADDVVPVAQTDQAPMGGRYPTSIWEPGEVIEDTFTLDISAVETGNYVLRLGLYHPESGRLQVVGGGDSVIVGEVQKE